jgi:hypothetical protein
MSTPEFRINSFLVKSNVYAHDVRDDVEDIIWRSEGKKTAKNDSKSVCGGDKPIGECATANDMVRQIIGQFITGIEQTPVDTSNPKLFNVGHSVTVNSSCGDCGKTCHAYGKVIDGKPSEKIRFMYEDPEASTRAETVSSRVSEQPIIATSFDEEFEYFKLEPRQLP